MHADKLNKLVDNWVTAEKDVDAARHTLDVANCRLRAMVNVLGAELIPRDALQGEAFHIWYGTRMIEAVKETANAYSVRWRE